jgi:hypothetical protein
MNQKLKIPLSLSQTSTPYRPNVSAFILPVSEGRAGKAWEPSNKSIPFLSPEIKRFSFLPNNFYLHLLIIHI